MMPSTVLSMVMKENDFHGPTMGVSAMCASGNAGLITAKSWIDTGVATDVLLLATDLSLMGQDLRGFVDVGVAVGDTPPFEACRPFQEGSRGFVAGGRARDILEQSGVLVREHFLAEHRDRLRRVQQRLRKLAGRLPR
ncbi:MAG: hypothetical protein B7W97_02075 [Mycobacterium sp. 20-66-4]|nr:MAG: hypothetical protein B7W97_02075 [Mycobacterium sp. 20-66-4]